MEKAVEHLAQAMQRKERTAIFGDFYVDGITATALLARVLERLGLPVLPYIPHRVEESHGLSLQAVQQLADAGVTLPLGSLPRESYQLIQSLAPFGEKN